MSDGKAIYLDWCVAIITNNKITIVSPSYTNRHVHAPAESITINGEKNLIALRDALNDILHKED